MGCGMSALLKERVQTSSHEELCAFFKQLDTDSRRTVVEALAQCENLKLGSGEEGDAQKESAIQVTVESMIGNVIGTFEFESAASMDDVMHVLCTATNTPLEHKHLLRLLMCGNILDCDDKSLCANGINGSQPLTLVRESGARLGVLPDFCGFYAGENSEGGGQFVWEMVMDSAEFIEISQHTLDNVQTGSYIEGVLHWRLLGTEPRCTEDELILRGREFVKGVVKEDGSFELGGYVCEPSLSFIANGLYSLSISSMGDIIRGTFKGPLGSSDGEFQLHRKDDATAAEWRKQRKDDILNCKTTVANEVRLGNQRCLNLQL